MPSVEVLRLVNETFGSVMGDPHMLVLLGGKERTTNESRFVVAGGIARDARDSHRTRFSPRLKL